MTAAKNNGSCRMKRDSDMLKAKLEMGKVDTQKIEMESNVGLILLTVVVV